MSLHHSPRIVTSGLQLLFDMANTKKSWRGSPTINVSLINGQNSINPWGGDGGATQLGIDPIVTFRGRKVAKFQTGSSSNCYLNGAGDLSTTITSTQWTSTFYIKRVDNVSISTVSGYLYVTNNTSVNAPAIVTQVENGWYKVVYTRSSLVSGYPTLTGMYGLGSSIQYYFAEWQCEPLSISTPYVDGTRTSTQSIIDLLNLDTLTLVGSGFLYGENSITMPNLNTSYIQSNNPVNYGMSNQNFSINTWVKQLDNSSNVVVESRGDNLIGFLLAINYPSAGKMSLFLNPASGQISYSTINSSLSIGVAQNITVCVNRITNTIKFYVNGDIFDTISNIHTNSISPISGNMYRIGYDKGGATTNMELYSYSHYNKELSAIEVKQNFNALRARYGI